MRTFLGSILALLLLVGSSVSAFAATEATPAAGEDTPAAASSGDVNPVNPQIGDEVTLFATNGDAIATVSVTDVERNWEGYDEYQEPESGTEFIAVTIHIESTISRGAVEVNPYDFSLQDGKSFLWSTAYASNEDSPKDVQVLSDTLQLAGGEDAEFLVVFQTYIDEPLQHVYWNPESSLLTLADLSDI
ncbi:MAG TPA: DUF4352 domain-containing protein [Thermomicrobiales bacterium]|nr:DUF4352 domain-containing protein [Thermomicrobiales bacterium]